MARVRGVSDRQYCPFIIKIINLGVLVTAGVVYLMSSYHDGKLYSYL